jgi:ribosomal-protein-alanine N-acetyltransferase
MLTPTLRTARLWLRPLAQAEPRVLEQIEAGTAIGWNLVADGTGRIWWWAVAYEIDAEYSGKGLTIEPVERVIEHARTELGLLRLEAHIGPENSRSIRLAERLGFTRESELQGAIVYTRKL